MTRHERLWMFTAFVTLAVATFVGFTVTARNLSHHSVVDKTICDRNVHVHDLMARTVQVLLANPGIESKEELQIINEELHALKEAEKTYCKDHE